MLRIVEVIENGERRYVNTCPYGEPRLGKRNLSDGSHSVIDIAECSKLAFQTLSAAIADLIECGLLIEANHR